MTQEIPFRDDTVIHEKSVYGPLRGNMTILVHVPDGLSTLGHGLDSQVYLTSAGTWDKPSYQLTKTRWYLTEEEQNKLDNHVLFLSSLIFFLIRAWEVEDMKAVERTLRDIYTDYSELLIHKFFPHVNPSTENNQ